MTVTDITVNDILSGISKAVYDVFGTTVSIYKEKQDFVDLPAVCIYCLTYERVMGRNDRFTNTYNVIINYFPEDNDIINNKRPEMFSQAQKIMDAIQYINLPAYQQDNEGKLVQTTLPSRAQDLNVEEQEDHMKISATYVVRTRKHTETVRMTQLDLDVTNK